MSTKASEVVIVGGSVAGLFAAAALTGLVDKVTLVERDELAVGPEAHKGVPQGRQIHVTLPVGLRQANELIPGLDSMLEAEGAPTIDLGGDPAFYISGVGWQQRVAADVPLTCFSRPLFEWVVRRHVAALPNVEIRQGSVAGLVASEDGSRVIGVRLNGQDQEILSAELVIDASGRGSKAPRWFEEIGYEAPAEQQVRAYAGYAGQPVRVPDGLLPNGLCGIAAHPSVNNIRGGMIWPIEGGKHMMVAVGMAKDYPPANREGVLEFLRGTSTPLLAELAVKCEPEGDVTTYRMPGNQLRHWESLDRRPEGFIAIGDAVASFNPIYAQGMTIAIFAATALRDELRASEGDNLVGFAQRYHQAVAPTYEGAFAQAASADVLYPGVEIEDFTLPEAEGGEYFEHLERLTTQDPEVAIAWTRMVGFMEHEGLFTDAMQKKVEAWVAHGAPITANTDPNDPPAA
ncbi:FAD-dependent oxidoreductase [Nocardia pseudovaccinii]|uniref:FAD-dependent oxidoreductase n=1 Tax=Nocardia pseudovaccinii TaxID=189540 RepID=UPI003D92EDA1